MILKEIIQNFREYEELEELYKKYENEQLTEKEREELLSIINTLRHINPIYLHLYLNIRGFKAYFQESHWWNPWLINEIKYKFLRHLSKKNEILKKSSKNLYEITGLLAKQMQKSIDKQEDQKNKFHTDVQNVIKELISKLVPQDKRIVFQQKAKSILMDYIIKKSGYIHHNTNPKTIGAAIIYLIPKIMLNANKFKLTQIDIANEIGISPSSISIASKEFSYLSMRSFKIKNITILNISEKIYQEIPENVQDFNLLWEEIQEIQDSIMKMFYKHNKSEEYKEFLHRFTLDLIRIIAKLKIINNHEIKERFEIFPFSQYLKNEGIDLCGRSLDSLAEIILKIFDHLRVNFNENFKLERKGFQGKYDVEQRQIRLFKNKFKLITDTFYFNVNGKKVKVRFNGNCMNPDCPSCADFKILPAIEFHQNKKLQRKNYISLGGASKMAYNRGKKEVESQEGGGLILCRNCHKLETSKLHKYFKEFLNKEDLFYDVEGRNRPAEDIIRLIQKVIKNHIMNNEGKRRSKKIKRYNIVVTQKLKIWVKKRAVIEQLYGKNYICPCCRDISIKNNLASFEFHHANKTIFKKSKNKTYFKRAFETLDVKELIERLIKEECICICANCHKLITTIHFKDNIESIIGWKYVKQVNEYHERLAKGVEKAHRKILQVKNLLETNEFKINNTLKPMVDKYKIWKRNLVLIYLKCKDTNRTFTSKDVTEALKFYNNWFNIIKSELLKRNLISEENYQNKTTDKYYRYKLTENGNKTARKIIKDWKANHPGEYIKLINKYGNK